MSELSASHSTARRWARASRKAVPRRQQLRKLLVQFGSEPAEGAFALDSTRQPPSGSLVADVSGELSHVLVRDGGRQRIDAEQVQLVEVHGRLAVDSGVGGPEHDFSGLGVDQPPVLVVGLVRQRGGDFLKVKAA
jgi:hypothetical protein